MTGAPRLHYLPGSPFARILRVLAREHGLPLDEVAVTDFPPPAAYFAVNPLGQVPVYERDGTGHFPTAVALEAMFDDIADLPPRPDLAPSLARPGHRLEDLRLLHVILGLADQVVTWTYLDWTGLAQVRPSRVGYEIGPRTAQRLAATLDWLEARAGAGGFRPDGLSAQDVAFACLILWTEARHPVPWRGRPALEPLVDSLAARPSFAATTPPPWAD